ncbi:MAG: hypothetical protein V3S11_02200, partial [Elusimicrobiota bacterium]
ARFAMHYSLWSPMALILAGGQGLSWARSGYSFSLAFLSPISGALAKRFTTRSVLIATAVLRGAIWAVAIPLLYWLLPSTALFTVGALGVTPFLAAFIALNLIDGAVVSINTLVDADRGGLSMLAKQHDFKVTPADEAEAEAFIFGWLNVMRFAAVPVLAAGLYLIPGLGASAAGLIGLFALVFGGGSALAAYYYLRIPADGVVAGEKNQGFRENIRQTYKSIAEGVKAAKEDPKIGWRLVFAAFERPIEELVGYVMVGIYAVSMMAPGNAALGTLYTSLLLAFGAGAAARGSKAVKRYMARFDPKNPDYAGRTEPGYQGYKRFFALTFLARAATLLMPLAVHLLGVGFWPSVLTMLAGIAIYNYISFQPRIAFNTMMKTAASEHDASTQIFGLQNTLTWTFNFAIMAMIGGLIAAAETGALSWVGVFSILSSVFVGIGAFEWLVGPRLLFSADERKISPLRDRIERIGLKIAGYTLSAGLIAGIYFLGGPFAAMGLIAAVGIGHRAYRAIRRKPLTNKELAISDTAITVAGASIAFLAGVPLGIVLAAAGVASLAIIYRVALWLAETHGGGADNEAQP